MTLDNQTADRFWSKVDKTDSCWIWTGTIDPDGYGRFALTHRKSVGAHRLSWEISNGRIPKGLGALHNCDVRNCVRPDHIYVGTQQDNSNDMVKRGRAATGLRNARYTHPETTARGLRHGWHTKPESRIRGDNHWRRKYPEKVPRGEDSGTAKLTEKMVREILVLFATGEFYNRDLARKFGMSNGCIQHIVKRRAWKHITI